MRLYFPSKDRVVEFGPNVRAVFNQLDLSFAEDRPGRTHLILSDFERRVGAVAALLSGEAEERRLASGLAPYIRRGEALLLTCDAEAPVVLALLEQVPANVESHSRGDIRFCVVTPA